MRARRAAAWEIATRDAECSPDAAILPIQEVECPAVRALRLWRFLAHEVVRLKQSETLTLAQIHTLADECRQRNAAIKRKLANEGISIVIEATRPSPKPENNTDRKDCIPKELLSPRLTIFDLLLDPQNIQWLMGFGGALMVVGLILLLWVKNFLTPPIMATCMGFTNISAMFVGLFLILKSRYQFAGKGLTLLACLVMPLNLWYYHSNGLVTVDGHLWMVATILCGIYAAAARILKDSTFVYVFNAGVAMTGLLLLADLHKVAEIATPAALLLALGLAGIHVERAFVEYDGPFSRQRFGRAFFISGHLLLGIALLMVFIAQLLGDWLYHAVIKPVYLAFNVESVPIFELNRAYALVLVLLGVYAYIYSDLVTRKRGYIHAAGSLLIWAQIIILQMLHQAWGLDAIIAVLASTSIVINLLYATMTRALRITQSFPTFGLLLSLLPVLLGVSQYLRFLGFRAAWEGNSPEWSYVGAMLLAAISSRLGAFIYRHSLSTWLPLAYHFATAAATMVAAVALLAACGMERWQEHAPVMMLIPIVYLIAARLYGSRGPSKPLTAVAHAATIVMLVSSLVSAFLSFTKLDPDRNLNLALVVFFAEASVFYGLAARFQRKPICVHVATLMACGVIWQLLLFVGVTNSSVFLLAFAGLGMLLLLAYRFSVLEQTPAAPLAEAAFQAANSLLSLTFVATFLRGLARSAAVGIGASNRVDLGSMSLSFGMLILSGLSVVLVQVAGWRRWYVVNVMAQAGLILLGLHQWIDLDGWQQLELFSVIAGVLLLAVGHIGWYREQGQESDSDLVSISLNFGSLLAAFPLAIATWIDRAQGRFEILNEAGFLFSGVLLLGTGVVFRLKSTTVVGVLSTGLYFFTLLLFIPWRRLDTIAVLIILGGSTLFGTGLILAFFRDRLLSLPERIKTREGVFRVLNWR